MSFGQMAKDIYFNEARLCSIRFLILSICVLTAATIPNSASGQNASNGLWQAQSIYQIITDRFFNGDTSNDNAEGSYNPSGTTSVHGGDFKGIEQKLDYIKALGATAIWISPVVKNVSGTFHGYAGQDFYTVAPHWGSLADLQHMIQAAHARGIMVIDDIVVNHGADLIYSTDSGYANFLAPPAGYNLKYRSASKQFASPFNTNASNPNLTNLFHNNGAIPDYNTPQHYQLGELSGLDDFRTESPYIRTNMAAVYQYWISQAGFDGFRIDTVKHVEDGFWQYWCPVVHNFAATNGNPNFFMFGEVYDNSDSLCGSYTGTESGGPFELDSVLDYPLFFQINSVFATASANPKVIQDRYNALPTYYDSSAQDRLVTFLDNHDQPRFMSASGATTNRLNVALVFLYTGRGIPSLYYGTEQAFSGTTDPNDREDMFAGSFEPDAASVGDNFNMTHPQFQLVAMLNNFRRLYAPLQVGSYVQSYTNSSGPGLFAYARRQGAQEVYVAFNTSSSTQTLPSRITTFPAGSHIVNLFDTNEVLTISAGPQIPSFSVPSSSAKIFVAQSAWRPLDPVVKANSPSHSSTNAARVAPIILQFSDAMDTNSVQNSFGTIPAVSGAFSWSTTHDTMTFTPSGSGFPALTTVAVRVTNAISAVSGNGMFAPYELKYKTYTNGIADLSGPVVTIIAPTNNATISGTFLFSGTATDNVSVATVQARLDGGPRIPANGTNNWDYNLNSSNFLNGPHQFSVKATDSSGNATTNSISTGFLNIPGAYLQRVAGGNSNNVIDCSGNLWLPDTAYSFGSFGYSNGTAGYLNNVVTGVCSSGQALYQREHYGDFTYQFDCPEGIYETTLLEAETYWSGPGQREFNVFIQAQQVLTNFDIYAAAGGKNLPISRVFTNAVTNSQLQVHFVPVVDNARVSGIQVRKIGEIFSGGDGIPDWWRLGFFGHAGGSAADKSRATDDADGDGISNLNEFLAGTNPLNSASAFRIAQFNEGSGQMQVGFTTTTNHSYQLQRTENLVSGTWTNIGPQTNGSGAVVVVPDSSATNGSEFYRALQVQ
jgi:glycosidase